MSAAEVLIIAADIALERPERFEGIRKLEVPVQLAITNPEAVFARL